MPWGFAKKPKAGKRNTRVLDIGSPTDFKHEYHIGVEHFPLKGNSPDCLPSTPNSQAFNRSNSEGPTVYAKTLPRNHKLNSSLPQNTCFGILDDVVHPTTEKALTDSARQYKAKVRPALFPEWNGPSMAASQKVSRWNSANFIENSDYMKAANLSVSMAGTPGSSAYGTMTSSMGTSSSRAKIITNPIYVDQATIERFRERSEDRQLKGILKYNRTDSVTEIENRLYQQAPFNERNLPSTSAGRRIRSSTAESKTASPRLSRPSPLTRPTGLSICQHEMVEPIVTPEIPPRRASNPALTPMSMSDPKTFSIIIKDERPTPLKQNEAQSVPSLPEEEDLDDGMVIYYL